MRYFAVITQLNIYWKWLLIVSLNSVSGFYWGGYVTGNADYLSMLLGVLTWFAIYLGLDNWLLNRARTDLSRRLRISATARIPLQLLVFPDVYAGMVAVFILQFFGFKASSLLGTYLLTLVTGLLLSLFCALIFVLISVSCKLSMRRHNRSKH